MAKSEPCTPDAILAEYRKSMYDADFGGIKMKMSAKLLPQAALGKVKQFKFFPDDIAVCSFPKTGTMWVSEMAYLIRNGGKPNEADGKAVFDKYKFLEFRDFATGKFHADLLNDVPPVRQMFSHLPSTVFEDLVLSPTSKIIIPFRNPKDALVSYYYMFKKLPFQFQDLTWDQFFEIYQTGNLNFGNPFDWLDTWWKYTEQENVFFILYEDIIKDHSGSVKKLAQFLGVNLTDEAIANIVHETTFKSMNDKKVFSLQLRKGKVGAWREHFNEEQSAYMDDIMEKRLTPLGITFD